METAMIEIRADAKEFSEFLEGLSADLAKSPHELRKLFLDFIDSGAELVCVDKYITSGAVVTALLKPSQRLIDLGAAIRTGDFDLFVVKHSHGESPVVDRSAMSEELIESISASVRQNYGGDTVYLRRPGDEND